MGKVVKMFGSGETSGPFGQSMNLGQAGSRQDGEPSAHVSVESNVSNADIEEGVQLALDYARVATNRLVNIPPAGAVPRSDRKALLDAYAGIEELARQIVDSARSSGPGIDLARETTRLQEDVQAYVDAVEAAIAPHLLPPTPAPAPASATASGLARYRYLIWGAAAVGVGLAGYAAWRAYKNR